MHLTLAIPAAGLGCRLAECLSDGPKGMTPVAGKPIIQWVLDAALQLPIDRAVMVVGPNHRQIQDYFGSSYGGLPIYYVQQSRPLGQADAIARVESYVIDAMLVMNGDEIFINTRHSEMYPYFVESRADAIVGYVRACDHAAMGQGYTLNLTAEDRVTGLIERPKSIGNGILGVGTWLFRRTFFECCSRTTANEERGECDCVNVLQLMLAEGRLIYGFDLDGKFINVNRPEDLRRAEAALRKDL